MSMAVGLGNRVMTNPSHTPVLRERLSRAFLRKDDYAMRQGILKLLAIKDSDIRLLTLEQCRDAVDKGLHAGGAFSSVIPLVALFYGGVIELDVEDPTRRGRIVFTLRRAQRWLPRAPINANLAISTARRSRTHARLPAF